MSNDTIKSIWVYITILVATFVVVWLAGAFVTIDWYWVIKDSQWRMDWPFESVTISAILIGFYTIYNITDY